MQFFKKFYMPTPGGENETGSGNKDDKRDKDDTGKEADKDKDEKKGHSKLHDALQQWSNDDARDIEEDDSSPLRSGL